MTQTQLAELIGTTQAAVSGLETGKANPTADTIAATAAALDMEIMFVPRKAVRQVEDVIASIEYHEAPKSSRGPGSAFDDVFIPDELEEDVSTPRPRVSTPRPRARQ